MNYIRVANPDFYNNWFENYDRPENILRVRTGIGALSFDTLNAKIRRERNDCGDNAYRREKEFYNMLEDLKKDAKKYEESSSNKIMRMVVRRPASDTAETNVTEIRDQTIIEYPKMSDKIKDIQSSLNLKH
jgi:hypothetical protein